MENLTLRDLRAAMMDLSTNPHAIGSIQRRVDVAMDELGAAESFLMGEESARRPVDPREILRSLDYKW